MYSHAVFTSEYSIFIRYPLVNTVWRNVNFFNSLMNSTASGLRRVKWSMQSDDDSQSPGSNVAAFEVGVHKWRVCRGLRSHLLDRQITWKVNKFSGLQVWVKWSHRNYNTCFFIVGSLSDRCIIGVHVVIGAAVIRCNSSAPLWCRYDEVKWDEICQAIITYNVVKKWNLLSIIHCWCKDYQNI